MSFVGIRGDSYLGDISVDEISVGDIEECHLGGSSTSSDAGANPKEGKCAADLVRVENDVNCGTQLNFNT